MRLLVRGLLSDHLLPPSTGPQRPQVRQPQPLTRLACPLGVSIFRQQLPAVKRRVVLGLKTLDVRLHHRPRCQRNLPSMNYNRIRFANRAAGEVRRLVQVRQRRVVRQLRPKRLDHLIAMQPMPTRQRKDLHQLRATTMLPSLLRHKTTISQRPENHPATAPQDTPSGDDLRSQRRRAQEREINGPDDAAHLAIGSARGSDHRVRPDEMDETCSAHRRALDVSSVERQTYPGGECSPPASPTRRSAAIVADRVDASDQLGQRGVCADEHNRCRRRRESSRDRGAVTSSAWSCICILTSAFGRSERTI